MIHKTNSNPSPLVPTMATAALVGSLHGISKKTGSVTVNIINANKRVFIVDPSGITKSEFAQTKHTFNFYKKVLNSVEKKLVNIINKLPKGEKLTSFLNSTTTDNKALFKKFAFNETLMLKGAGFAAVTAGVLYMAVKGISSIFKGHKED